jgi:hypothetical protein
MNEEQILRKLRKEIDTLLPVLGNGMSYNDFVDEIIELARKAMEKARHEAQRGN